jgi:uncharacterized membrane protein (UPF0136 family)
MKTAWIVLFYAFSILIGGIIGHIKAGSLASLLSGIFSSVFLLGSSWLMFKRKKSGYISAFVGALVLEGFFIWRFAKTLNFIPSGLLSVITLIIALIIGFKLGKNKA